MMQDPHEMRRFIAGLISRAQRGKKAWPPEEPDLIAADAVVAETRWHSVVALPQRVHPAFFAAGGLLQPVSITNPSKEIPSMVRQGDDVFLPPEHARLMAAALIAGARLAEQTQAEFMAAQGDDAP
ncbi:hypothetical protein [Nocardia sp. NPDC057227]|uniref:hypothetical protein n=1 Tax=Nocardia sp. NPDC057227 TaxID=3346056 RepID=UPI0036333901